MKTLELRSDCPINATLQVVGDAWSLIIIRDMVYFGKKTFGDFAASKEAIARNILTARLSWLVANGIITKAPHPSDGRKDIYGLTEKGLDLIPILLDMADWGAVHAETVAPEAWLTAVRTRRDEVIATIRETVKAGGSVFVGDNAAVRKVAAGTTGKR